jgi:hypothetical protein
MLRVKKSNSEYDQATNSLKVRIHITNFINGGGGFRGADDLLSASQEGILVHEVCYLKS